MKLCGLMKVLQTTEENLNCKNVTEIYMTEYLQNISDRITAKCT